MRALLRPNMGALQTESEPAAFTAYRQFYGTQFAHTTTHSALLEVQDYPLVAQLWQPANTMLNAARGTLIFLHGYYDHVGLYRHVIEWALNQNLAVWACDLPGHGLSGGARADIGDFSEYQAVLQELLAQAAQMDLPRPWHLLGQSTGGGIVLDYLLRGIVQEDIGHAILFSPLIRPRAWPWLKLAWHVISPFTQGIQRRFSDNSSDAAFLAFVRRDPLQPQVLPCRWVGAMMRWIPLIEAAVPNDHRVLLVQGQADRTLDWQHNLRVLTDKLPNAQRLLLPTARHHLANESEALRQQYWDFLNQHIE